MLYHLFKYLDEAGISGAGVDFGEAVGHAAARLREMIAPRNQIAGARGSSAVRADRRQAEAQRHAVQRIEVGRRAPDVEQEMIGLRVFHAQQHGQVRQADDDGGRVDESHQYRVRKEVEQYPHAQQVESDLEQARRQRECDRISIELLAARRRQRCNAGRGQQ